MNSKNSTSRSTPESSTMKGAQTYVRSYDIRSTTTHGFVVDSWYTPNSRQRILHNTHIVVMHETTRTNEIPF
jgi:hypothetical protein